MKLLLITSDYVPHIGGIATVLSSLKRHSPEDTLMVFAPAREGVESEGSVLRIPYFRKANPLIKLRQIFRWYRHVCYWVKHQKEPVKIIFGTLCPLTNMAPLVKFFTGTSYSLFAYAGEIPTKSYSSLRRWCGRLLYHGAEHVLCISDYTEKRVKSLAPRAKTQRVHLGVDSQTFKPVSVRGSLRSRYRLNGEKVLFTMGRLVKRKGFDTAIEAVAELKRRGEKVKLLIGGTGPEEDHLKSLVSGMDLEQEVAFCGFIEQAELAEHHALSNVFLFLSREENDDAEGFGLVVLEAGACGKPVVAGSSGGVPNAVINGKTGFLVRPRNLQQVVKAIMELLQDEALCERMSAHALEHAKENSWERFTSEVYQILEMDSGC